MDDYKEIPEGSRLEAEVGRPPMPDEKAGAHLVRGRGAYGKKPSRSVISRIARETPVTIHHYDEAEDTMMLETVQNVNPIVEAAQEFKSSGADGYSPSRELRHVAYLPVIIVDQLLKQGINAYRNEDWPKVSALLDSKDYSKFRTGGGRISRRPVRDYVQREGWQKR